MRPRSFAVIAATMSGSMRSCCRRRWRSGQVPDGFRVIEFQDEVVSDVLDFEPAVIRQRHLSADGARQAPARSSNRVDRIGIIEFLIVVGSDRLVALRRHFAAKQVA